MQNQNMNAVRRTNRQRRRDPVAQLQSNLDRRLNIIENRVNTNGRMNTAINFNRRIRRPRRVNAGIRRRGVMSRRLRIVDRNRIGNSSGCLTVTMREKWADVYPGMNSFAFQPGATGIPMLDHLAKAFDTYHLMHCTLHLTSSSSTSKNGTFSSAVDYLNRAEISEAELFGLNGFVQDNVYKKQERNVIIDQAMKQRLHATATHDYPNSGVPSKAFTYFVYTDAQPETIDQRIGQVFVTYTIRFESANPPNGADGKSAAQSVSTYINGVSHLPQIMPPINTSENTGMEQTVTILEGLANLNGADGVVCTARFDGLSQNSTFTIASTAPTTTNERKFVQFRTIDGQVIPPGTIVPFETSFDTSGALVRSFESIAVDGIVYDLLATVYKIAKPWLKSIPILADVITIIEDNSVTLAADDPQDLVPNASAFAIGEELDITLPDSDTNVLTDLSTTLAGLLCTTVSGGHHLSYLNDASQIAEDNQFTFVFIYNGINIPQTGAIGPDVGEGHDFQVQFTEIETATPLVPGDVLQVSFTFMDTNNSDAFITNDFTPKPELNIGVKQIVEGSFDYYVVEPIAEGQTRTFGFTDPTGAWPTAISGSPAYGHFSFSLTRMGSCKRTTSSVVPNILSSARRNAVKKSFKLKAK